MGVDSLTTPATHLRRELTLMHRLSLVARNPAIFVLGFAFLYLATPTSDYFWDGITFALQIEKVANGERSASLLFHQSHLLYNAIGYLFYRVAHAIGFDIRALTLLQMANSIIGAIGVGIFFSLARRLTKNFYAATISALALGFSATWWKLSTDCDAYLLATVLLMLCLLNLLSSKPRWYVAGLLLAAAMLIHELASLFSIAAILAVSLNSRIENRRKFIAGMIATAWTLAISTYYLVAVTMFNITQPLAVVKWATTNPSLITPEINPLPGLLMTPRTNLDLFLGHSFSIFRQQGRWIETVFAIAALLAAIVFAIKVVRGNRLMRFLKSLRPASIKADKHLQKVLNFLAVWVILYNVFLCFFEPGDPYLRLFYAPALALALGMVLSHYHAIESQSLQTMPQNSSPSGAALFAVAAFACFNLAFFILLFSQANANPLIHKARDMQKVWDDKTVVFFAGRNEADTTFQYFNEQTRWQRFSSEPIDALPEKITNLLYQGSNVWLNKGALASTTADFFQTYEADLEVRVDSDFSPAHYLRLKLKERAKQ